MSIVSDLIRHPQGRVAARIAERGAQDICISVITVAELHFGCAKRGSARLLRQTETVLSGIATLPFEPQAAIEYGRLRAMLEALGTPIGPNDLFIAAHALSLGLTLVTANVGEFHRVRGLPLENWLE